MMTPVEENLPTILLVDDEPRILSALQRLLRREDYRILTADSGAAALAILDQESVSIILSDLRMPGMDGFEFFGAVRDRGFDAARVLMSGNADLKSIIDGVNEGRFSQVIEKPWVDDTLKVSLRKLIEARALELENKALMIALQRQNHLLSEATEKAANELRQKERLFATISHEVRNPLHGIQGVLELMSRDSVGDDQKLLSTAITSAEIMRQILDDVLDYSKVEAGKMVLQKVTFSPVALVTDVIALMQPMATGQNLTLELYYEEAIAQQFFKGDDFRIRQILNNLLSNAIKYTKQGGVGVEITAEQVLRFAVIDTGIGIPEEKMNSLFDAFVMVDDQHDRTFGGTGLGLTIVKNLADLMGGEIKVSARQGGGTVFTLELPLESAAPEVDAVSARNLDQVLVGMDVVVVDDMVANRIIVENLLPRYGATVHGFADGEALLAFLSESGVRPDLFLLDINMPGMKGDEVLRAVKAYSPELAGVPAFAMSGSLNFKGSEQVVDLFTGLFSKPFSIGQLLALAQQYAPSQAAVEGAPVVAVGAQSAAGAQSAEGSNPEIDHLISEMGAEFVAELSEAFKSSLTRALTNAKTDLISAQQVVDVAHALKPTAGMLGFGALSVCCQQIDALRSTGDISPAIERRVELLSNIEITRERVERLLDDLKNSK